MATDTDEFDLIYITVGLPDLPQYCLRKVQYDFPTLPITPQDRADELRAACVEAPALLGLASDTLLTTAALFYHIYKDFEPDSTPWIMSENSPLKKVRNK